MYLSEWREKLEKRSTPDLRRLESTASTPTISGSVSGLNCPFSRSSNDCYQLRSADGQKCLNETSRQIVVEWILAVTTSAADARERRRSSPTCERQSTRSKGLLKGPRDVFDDSFSNRRASESTPGCHCTPGANSLLEPILPMASRNRFNSDWQR